MGNVSEYRISCDENGKQLSGSKKYRLRLSADIPSSVFWSVIVYNKADNLIIITDQLWPSVHSNLSTLVVNEDGSVDIYFGPEDSLTRGKNWIKTLPRKKWYAMIRFYDSLEKSVDNIWKWGKIVPLVNAADE